MKLKNIALAGSAIVVAAVAFGIYYVATSLDEIVQTAIETYGSEIAGTSVRVSSVQLQLREGKGAIRGLRIANPDGFPSGDAVSFGEIALDLDVNSLGSRDPLVITLISIGEPSVSLVMDAQGRSNLQVIQKNTARYSSGGGSAPATSEGPPTLLAIRELSVEGGRLAADLTAVGGQRVDAKLPALRLSNLGGEKGGTPGEIGAAAARQFLDNALKAVARSQINDQLDRLLDEKLGGAAGRGAKDMLKGLFNR